MKLLNLQVFPRGERGWGTEVLVFGNQITQLFGPNGCGKTPLVQTITYCLGYQSTFREDIYDRCSHAILEINSPKGKLILRRVYSRDVDIEVIEPKGNKQRFLNEQDYSKYLFNWFGLEVNNLVDKSNRLTTPYLSSMLPIFYLDQDSGYSHYYCPPNNFIKNQFSEMVRMLFGLPVKNSFDLKKGRIKVKETLNYLDKRVELFREKLELSEQNVLNVFKDSNEISIEILGLEAELENIKGSGASHDDSINILDRLISSHRNSIREISIKTDEINKRNKSIHQIIHEINTEIETLNLNEEARRIFLSFNEICASSHCQLFSSSSESYSKNLLYLKDQIKDLERNTKVDKIKSNQLTQQKESLENLVQTIVDERNITLQKSEISALIDTISTIKNQIFKLQNQLNDIKEVEDLANKLVKVVIKRDLIYEKLQSLSTAGSPIPRLIKLRADLRKYFLHWLDVLNTNNISRDITFSDDFIPILGREKLQQLKGSTKLRAVLAYHAALLELIVRDNYSSFKLLILDTPKQHEIHSNDLDRYLKKLKDLSQEFGFQIVFSTTEYHYQGDSLDKEWVPLYPVEKKNMFLTTF